MRTVLIILFDGVQALDVSGPIEVFDGANRWQARHHARPAYEIRTASLGGHMVRTSSGLRLAPDSDLRQLGPPDRGAEIGPEMLIVPGGAGSRRADPDLVSGCGHTAGVPSAWFPCAQARSCSPRPGCSTAGR